MMTCAILFESVLPWWAVAACCLLFGWLAWRTYGVCKLSSREKLLLWGLRMLAFLLLSWMLFMPSLRRVFHQSEAPAVAVVTDISASMNDNPMESDETRGQRALSLLNADFMKNALANARVYYFGVGEDLQEGWRQGQFVSPKTRIAYGLSRLQARFRGDNLAAVILLSDGLDQDTSVFDPSSFGAPIYVPELEEGGTPRRGQELEFAVGALGYPKRVIANWKANINVSVKRVSGSGDASFSVKLMHNGKALKNETVAFSNQETVKHVTFEIEPSEVGAQVYAVEIFPEDDQDKGNNNKEFLIEVTDARKRILYLEGTPRWEFKFLKRSLLSEKNLQLTAFLQAGDGSFINFDESGAGGELPQLNAETLRQYKAVILGNLSASALPDNAAAELCRFVEKGGGLLVIGGSKAYDAEGVAFMNELKPIMPVKHKTGGNMREGRFSVDFTPEGRAISAFSTIAGESHFPPLLSIWSPVVLGEFSTSFMTATDGTPVLVGSRGGQGRTAVILSDSLWRWQMGGGTGEGGKGLYGRFITQLLYWLAPDDELNDDGELLQVFVDESEVDLNQKVSIGAIGAGKGVGVGVNCTVTTPSGKKLVLPMVSSVLGKEVGISRKIEGFKCEVVPTEIGTYKLEFVNHDGSRRATTVLLARYPEHEMTGAVINRRLLHALAEKSGGQWTTWGRSDKLLDGLKLEKRTLEVVEERPIWNHWLGLSILLALYCLEWYLRRKWDLV